MPALSGHQYLLLFQGESSSLGCQCHLSRPAHHQVAWGTRVSHPNLPPQSRARNQCLSQKHSTRTLSGTSEKREGPPEVGCMARPCWRRCAAELKLELKSKQSLLRRSTGVVHLCSHLRQLCRRKKCFLRANCVTQSLDRGQRIVLKERGERKWKSTHYRTITKRWCRGKRVKLAIFLKSLGKVSMQKKYNTRVHWSGMQSGQWQ